MSSQCCDNINVVVVVVVVVVVAAAAAVAAGGVGNWPPRFSSVVLKSKIIC